MAIVEYPRGAAFPGVIGPPTDSRARPGRRRCGPRRAPPTCSSSSSTTPASATSAATAAPSRRRTSTPSPTTACASTTCHHGALLPESRLRRHRAQPPQQRIACFTEFATGYRLQRHHAVRDRHALRDSARARLQHLHGRQVAPDAQRPRPRPVPTTAGRWRAASSASTASSAATPAGYPDLVYDNHQVEPPATQEEGYHLTPDLVDKSIEFIADSRQIDPDKPFYLHLCFGATALRTPARWRRGVGRQVRKGKFDDGLGQAYRGSRSARPKELGIVPEGDAELSRSRFPDVPRVGLRCRDRRRASSTAHLMGVFAGFLEHTRRPARAAASAYAGRAQGVLENTIVVVICRTTGPAPEGGAHRDRPMRVRSFCNNAHGAAGGEPAAVLDAIGRPQPRTTTTPGAGPGAGDTALPALEDAKSYQRAAALRPVRSSTWPGGHPGQGSEARPPVRARHRHACRRVLDARSAFEPTGNHHGRPSRSRRFRASASRHTLNEGAVQTTATHTQYFEMLGHRAIDHDGWRAVCSWPGPVVHRGAASRFGQPITRREALGARCARLGSSTTSTRPRREPRTPPRRTARS